MSAKLTKARRMSSLTFCHDCGKLLETDKAAWSDDGSLFCHPCLAALAPAEDDKAQSGMGG